MTLIFGTIFIVFTVILYIMFLRKDKAKLNKAFKKSRKSFIQNSIRIFAVFILIGLLQSFLSKEAVGGFLLEFTGVKGILAGLVAGSIMMGPAATGYPIAQYVFNNGGTVSLATAFLASWVMIGIITLSMEIKYLGKNFAIARNLFAIVSVIIIAIITGLLI